MRKAYLTFSISLLFLATAGYTQDVGIGTTNPQVKLDVRTTDNGVGIALRTLKDSIGASTLLRFSTSANLFTFPDDRSSFLGNYRTGSGSNLIFGTASSGSSAIEKMRFSYQGHLGIGTDDPIGRLHIDMTNTADDRSIVINDDDDALIEMQKSGIARGFVQVSGIDMRIGTTADNNTGDFIVRTNGADRMWVHQNGTVSIGTETVALGFRVSILGKIMCEELQVKLLNTWPDYVFHNGYKLKSIYSLEHFVKRNQHLPGIPSAKEMDEKGMGVGEMQRLQMEKIEELTLYIIQLKKEIDALKKEIKSKN